MKVSRNRVRIAVRNAGFYAAMVALVWTTIEVGSLIGFGLVSDEPFSFAGLQQDRSTVIETPDQPLTRGSQDEGLFRSVRNQVIHPYVGFVLDPNRVRGKSDVARNSNRYGLLGLPPPFGRSERSGDTLVVAVVGGSVAMQLVVSAAESLSRALQEADAFASKEVLIANLALGGMKQPQQLMVVDYLLSLDARFDIVINIDGFNEMVLPVVENRRQNTFPFYPRTWKVRLGGLSDLDMLQAAGQAAYVARVRQGSASLFSAGLLRYSVTANVVWYLLDHRLDRWNEELRATLSIPSTQDRLTSHSYEATGPEQQYPSDDAFLDDLAAFWSRTSKLMDRQARGNGFHYFHFLQPNQYVTGSKIFDDKERAIALPKHHPYAEAARTGYAYLMEAGDQLTEHGVAYTDLTMLFEDVSEELYVDGCCHFNRRGYDLIAREIARIVNVTLSKAN